MRPHKPPRVITDQRYLDQLTQLIISIQHTIKSAHDLEQKEQEASLTELEMELQKLRNSQRTRMGYPDLLTNPAR